MKTITRLLFPAFVLAAFALPSAGQEGEAGQTFEESMKAETPAPAPKKKGKARRKKEEPPSEYKFKAEPETPTYKFDKHAEPIVKKPKKKKGKASKDSGGSGEVVPKLKRVKSFNEPDAPAQGQGPGGVQLPPGVKIPGMGGN